jgi:hypothetical protein
MRDGERVRLWDNNTGSEYLADWVSGHWVFAEREWGGVRWYDVPTTEELLQKLGAWLDAASPVAA